MKTNKVVALISGVVLDSEPDVEAVKSIGWKTARSLAEALQYGSAILRVALSAKSGSPTFTIAGVEASIDGTNYFTLRTLDSAISCAANGDFSAPLNGYAIVADARITKLRLVMGGSAPDGSNKITATVQLVLQVP